jgi:hypothetical protein
MFKIDVFSAKMGCESESRSVWALLQFSVQEEQVFKVRKIGLVSILILGLVVPISSAGAAVKPGSVCKPLASSKVVKGIKYTCIKSKGKLVWNKGVSAVKPSISETPESIVSISPTPTAESIPAPTPSPITEVMKDVTAGAFCAPAGAVGVTKTGLQVSCKTSSTDTRNRWRQ